MTAREWLAKRAELEQAATEGPWRAALLDGVDYEDGSSSYRGGIYPGQLPGPAPVFLTNSIDAHSAAFIADARTSAPAMRKALEAVLELHHRRPWEAHDGAHFGQTEFPDQCDHCRLAYPCDTVAAIEAALGVES